MNPERPAHPKKTLEFYHDELAIHLLRFYKEKFPKSSSEEFFKTILRPLKRLQADGDMHPELANYGPNTDRYQLFVISCSYWVQSTTSLREGDREDAWSFCLDAYFYYAKAQTSSNSSEQNPVEIIDSLKMARSELGKKAARAKDERRARVRAMAVQLATERGSEGRLWPSYAQLAKEIKGAVLKYANEQGLTLSQDRATVTITEYLKRASDVHRLISKDSAPPTGKR